MKQIFKGRTLTQNRVINRLVYWQKLNPEKAGGNFYDEANQFASVLSKNYNLPVLNVAGIIAALSPQQAWDVNKKQAVQYLKTNKATGATGERLRKCDKIRDAKTTDEILAILGGEKTKNFFLNIAGDYSAVCIDRHALACAIFPPSEICAISDTLRKTTVKQYNFFATCYKLAAEKVGEQPSVFQAIVWNAVREKRELRTHLEVNQF